jgi:hypothetical protein
MKGTMKEKIIDIDGQKITIRELETDDVCEIFDTPEGQQMLYDLMMGSPTSTRKLMRKSVQVSDAEFNTLSKGINAFTLLEAAFREVNGPFFDSLPGKAGGLINLGGAIGIKMPPSLKSPAHLSKKGT